MTLLGRGGNQINQLIDGIINSFCDSCIFGSLDLDFLDSLTKLVSIARVLCGNNFVNLHFDLVMNFVHKLLKNN